MLNKQSAQTRSLLYYIGNSQCGSRPLKRVSTQLPWVPETLRKGSLCHVHKAGQRIHCRSLKQAGRHPGMLIALSFPWPTSRDSSPYWTLSREINKDDVLWIWDHSNKPSKYLIVAWRHSKGRRAAGVQFAASRKLAVEVQDPRRLLYQQPQWPSGKARRGHAMPLPAFGPAAWNLHLDLLQMP